MQSCTAGKWLTTTAVQRQPVGPLLTASTHQSSPNMSPVLLATFESVTKAGTLAKGRASTSIASPV